MAKPKDLNPAFFKKNAPKGLQIDPKTAVYLEFIYVHYTHYPKLSANSKDPKVMRDRVNQIRQMTVGLKKASVAMNAAIKTCKDTKVRDEFLMPYLELLRTAERDRQNWIKIERGVGNTDNLQEMLMAQSLHTLVRI
jgi:hypothetical protein